MTKFLSSRWLTVFLIIGIGTAAVSGYWLRRKRDKDYVFVELRAFQTPGGWGYDILQDKQLYIHQDIIPVFPGKHSFRTREDALAIGRRVLDRIHRKQLFDVTLQDLKEEHIDTIQTKSP
ncbi:MAG TPA: DUF4907 domain-containing protein [Puia sp.]|nr:DUF4907 domain-containing protein [Puia sp.]